MSESEQRAAFEVWMKKAHPEAHIARYGPGTQFCGEYRRDRIQIAWEAWQAAIKHAKKTM